VVVAVVHVLSFLSTGCVGTTEKGERARKEMCRHLLEENSKGCIKWRTGGGEGKSIVSLSYRALSFDLERKACILDSKRVQTSSLHRYVQVEPKGWRKET
jgi:hypothetical protein